MLNFTLKQLKYVEAAARLGSIAKAGAELNISQSSITAAIDALEEALDYDIFTNTGKGIQTTPSGTEILQLIRGADQSRHFEADVQPAVASIRPHANCLLRYSSSSFLPPISSHFRKVPAFDKAAGRNMQKIMISWYGRQTLSSPTKIHLTTGTVFDAYSTPRHMRLCQSTSCSLEKCQSRSWEKPMVLLDLPRTREYFISMFNERGLHPNIVHSTVLSENARTGRCGIGSILNIRPTIIMRIQSVTVFC